MKSASKAYDPWLNQGISEQDVQSYRDAGYSLHNEKEYQGDTLIRDDWYAAGHEWLANYLDSGGIWQYKD